MAMGDRRVILPVGVPEPQTLGAVVDDLDQRLRSGRVEDYRPIATGFVPLDEYLGGGLHAEDLVLIGGIQNVGKTVLVLQAARNIARKGRALPVVVCYEHSPLYLVHRLVCLESIDHSSSRAVGGVTRDAISAAVVDGLERGERVSLDWLLATVPGADAAWARISGYLEGLWLVLGDGLRTTDEVLDQYVQLAFAQGYSEVVLFVDYLQIVPVRPSLAGDRYDDVQRISAVMKALKATALRHHVPVVAVAAADEEAVRQQRVHLENLWGPSLVQYQPDVALILNRGGLVSGEERSKPVRVAIEKNRGGPSEVEMEFVLHGPYYAFNPTGQLVSAEDSYQQERVALGANPARD
jgi:replicative DNA helicase